MRPWQEVMSGDDEEDEEEDEEEEEEDEDEDEQMEEARGPFARHILDAYVILARASDFEFNLSLGMAFQEHLVFPSKALTELIQVRLETLAKTALARLQSTVHKLDLIRMYPL